MRHGGCQEKLSEIESVRIAIIHIETRETEPNDAVHLFKNNKINVSQVMKIIRVSAAVVVCFSLSPGASSFEIGQQAATIRKTKITTRKRSPSVLAIARTELDGISSIGSKVTPASGALSQARNTRTGAIYEIHRGISASMVRGSPTLGGITLCRGWSDDATRDFKDAVEQVVQANPILTGQVYDHMNSVRIKTNMFAPKTHEFVRMLEPPENVPDLTEMNDTEIMEYMSKNILPLMEESELVSKQIREKLPVFGGSLMVLNNEYAIFSLKMSHAVGDGTTFFQLLKQVSLFMSNLPVPPINWDCPSKAKHEFYPTSMSKRDIFIYYGPPFLMGCLRNILTQKREPQLLLVDKQKVAVAKKSQREKLENKNISSNDVITAALCQSNPNADVFVFTENVRGVDPKISTNAGGNFIWEVPVPREICSKPDQLRKVIVSHQNGYETNHLPLLPFISGRHARVSSLASVTENVLYNGVKTVAVLPFSNYLTEIPLDIALIFRFNRDCWGIVHNFVDLEPSDLLQDIMKK